MRVPLFAVVTIVAATPAVACAQGTAPVEVHAGSALVDARRVAARTDTFAMAFHGGGSALLVIHTAALGDTALLRVERILVGGAEASTDSFAARRPTLEPLYDENRNAETTRHLTFPRGRVFGKTIPASGAARPVSATLDPPAFYANTSDLLLASLPLEAGKSFSVAMWSPDSGPYVLHARVARTETVPTLEGGRCEAWRIEATEPDGQHSVYWVERRSQALLAYTAGQVQLRITRHPACRVDDGSQRATR
jgi:hypothetical protein